MNGRKERIKFITKDIVTKLTRANGKILNLVPHYEEDAKIRVIQNLDNCNVDELNLSHNVIEKIENVNIPNLTVLNLSNNMITKIENLPLRFLRRLNLSGNRIERIPVGIKNLPCLSYLILSYNPIGILADIEHLKPLKNLIDLNLIGTLVDSLPQTRSYVYYQLRTLIIYNNKEVDSNDRDLAVERYGKLETDTISEELHTARQRIEVLEIEKKQLNVQVESTSSDYQRTKEALLQSQQKIKSLERQLAIHKTLRNDVIDKKCEEIEATRYEKPAQNNELLKKLQEVLDERPVVHETVVTVNRTDYKELINSLNTVLPNTRQLEESAGVSEITQTIKSLIQSMTDIIKERNVEIESLKTENSKINTQNATIEKLKYYADSMKVLIIRRKEKLKMLKDAFRDKKKEYDELKTKSIEASKEIKGPELNTKSEQRENELSSTRIHQANLENHVTSTRIPEDQSDKSLSKLDQSTLNDLLQKNRREMHHLDEYWDKKYQELSMEIGKLRGNLQSKSAKVNDSEESVLEQEMYFEESLNEENELDHLPFSPIRPHSHIEFTETPFVMRNE